MKPRKIGAFEVFVRFVNQVCFHVCHPIIAYTSYMYIYIRTTHLYHTNPNLTFEVIAHIQSKSPLAVFFRFSTQRIIDIAPAPAVPSPESHSAAALAHIAEVTCSHTLRCEFKWHDAPVTIFDSSLRLRSCGAIAAMAYSGEEPAPASKAMPAPSSKVGARSKHAGPSGLGRARAIGLPAPRTPPKASPGRLRPPPTSSVPKPSSKAAPTAGASPAAGASSADRGRLAAAAAALAGRRRLAAPLRALGSPKRKAAPPPLRAQGSPKRKAAPPQAKRPKAALSKASRRSSETLDDPAASASDVVVLSEADRPKPPLPRGSMALDVATEPEASALADTGKDFEPGDREVSGWSWKLGWIGIVPPGDPHGMLLPSAALPSLHGILAMGTQRINRHSLRDQDRFPDGLIAKGRSGNVIIWGNGSIVESFVNSEETLIQIPRRTAPAAVDVMVLQTIVRFHVGNIYHEDLGQDLPVAVIVPTPSTKASLEEDAPWDAMFANDEWCDIASRRSSEVLRHGTRIIFGTFGSALGRFAADVSGSLCAHCCCLAEGPRQADDENPWGNGVWMVGPHTKIQGPPNRRGADAHDWPVGAWPFSGSAPAGYQLQHGRPLRISMFRTLTESPDMTSCPIVYLGQGRRQRQQNLERTKRRKMMRRQDQQQPGSTSGARGSRD